MASYNLSAFNGGLGVQLFDDNGDPLAGGFIYTYIAGGTTPKATYTTSVGNVANANPIELDAGGRSPNAIYQEVGVDYKFIVTDSTGADTWTYDNIPSINDPFSLYSILSNVTGTNTIAATGTPTVASYVTGATYSFIPANDNSGAVTIAIDGLTAKAISKNNGTALSAGDLQAGKLALIEYDGTRFQLLNNIIIDGSHVGGTVSGLTAPIAVADGGTGTTSDVKVVDIVFIIEGSGDAITTGVKGDLEIPFACTINSWTLLADQTGAIVIDVWKDVYANFPPTVADTIAGTEKPTLSSALKNQDTSLTTWTTAVAAGDILRFNVDSATTVTRVTLSIKATRT
jgi:hypothetical protein